MRNKAILAMSIILLALVVGTGGIGWATCSSGDHGIVGSDRDSGSDTDLGIDTRSDLERELLAMTEDMDKENEEMDQSFGNPDQDIERPYGTEESEPIGLLADLDIDIDRDEGVGEEVGEGLDEGAEELGDALED